MSDQLNAHRGETPPPSSARPLSETDDDATEIDVVEVTVPFADDAADVVVRPPAKRKSSSAPLNSRYWAQLARLEERRGFRCERCEQPQPSLAALVHHRVRSKCGEKMMSSSSSSLSLHFWKVNAGGSVWLCCPLCRAEKGESEGMSRHLEICVRSTVQKEDAERRRREDTEFCEECLVSGEEEDCHQLISLACPRCGRGFSTRHHYRLHAKIVHDVDGRELGWAGLTTTKKSDVDETNSSSGTIDVGGGLIPDRVLSEEQQGRSGENGDRGRTFNAEEEEGDDVQFLAEEGPSEKKMRKKLEATVERAALFARSLRTISLVCPRCPHRSSSWQNFHVHVKDLHKVDVFVGGGGGERDLVQGRRQQSCSCASEGEDCAEPFSLDCWFCEEDGESVFGNRHGLRTHARDVHGVDLSRVALLPKKEPKRSHCECGHTGRSCRRDWTVICRVCGRRSDNRHDHFLHLRSIHNGVEEEGAGECVTETTTFVPVVTTTTATTKFEIVQTEDDVDPLGGEPGEPEMKMGSVVVDVADDDCGFACCVCDFQTRTEEELNLHMDEEH